MPSPLEILEAHTFGHSLLTVRGFCDGCDWNSYTGPKIAVEEHRAHLAQVLDEAMREAKEEGWNSAKNAIRNLPFWYSSKDEHGFDMCEDEDGISHETGARIAVMRILENNPYRTEETK